MRSLVTAHATPIMVRHRQLQAPAQFAIFLAPSTSKPAAMSQSIFKSVVTSVVKGIYSVAAPLLINPKLSKHSLACLAYVKEHANRGDPESVVRTIDEFAKENMMMNVGDAKGAIVDAEIRKMKPAVIVEIGAYTGYSTVRFASVQREAAGGQPSHFYSFEYSPDYAARVREMVAFAGLEDQVTVIEGAFADNLKVLAGKAVDIYFIDHDMSLYVADTKRILESGTLRDGSLLIADNVLFPGAPDYLELLDKDPRLTTVLHTLPIEQLPIIDDAVSVATFTSKP